MGLYTWQQPSSDRLVEILTKHPIALNASETGTGKTFVALDVLRRLERKAVIISPKSVITAWRAAADALGVSANVLDVLNLEKIQTGRTRWFDRTGWKLPAGAMLVIDEVHRGCSGPSTKSTQIVAYSKAYNIPVLAQSATIADSPLKMRAIGYLLGLHKFNASSFYEWCRANGCYKSPWHSGLEFPKGPKGRELMAAVHTQIADKLVRLKIQDIPEFPECELEANLYDLDAKYTKEINAAYEVMADRLKKPGANQLVEVLNARQRTEAFKVPLLVDLTEDFLAEGKSVVIFVGFHETMHHLAEDLRDYGCSYIVGGQSQEQRDNQIGAFQTNENRICICMIQAGGVGVSLHDVRGTHPRVALINPSWSAVEVKQALGRIHRAGGTKALQIFVLAAGTIEEKMYRAIKRKLGNISALNGELTDSDLDIG